MGHPNLIVGNAVMHSATHCAARAPYVLDTGTVVHGPTVDTKEPTHDPKYLVPWELWNSSRPTSCINGSINCLGMCFLKPVLCWRCAKAPLVL